MTIGVQCIVHYMLKYKWYKVVVFVREKCLYWERFGPHLRFRCNFWLQPLAWMTSFPLSVTIMEVAPAPEWGLKTLQGAVSIRKTVLLGMVIPMLKIRRPTGRLIFNMGIPIPGKTVFYIETGPWYYYSNELKQPQATFLTWIHIPTPCPTAFQPSVNQSRPLIAFMQGASLMALLALHVAPLAVSATFFQPATRPTKWRNYVSCRCVSSFIKVNKNFLSFLDIEGISEPNVG